MMDVAEFRRGPHLLLIDTFRSAAAVEYAEPGPIYWR